MFETLGFESCDSDTFEPGTDKVAIYVKDGQPVHAAIQRSRWGGRWRSKLGGDADIEHDLMALEGGIYGEALHFLKRQ